MKAFCTLSTLHKSWNHLYMKIYLLYSTSSSTPHKNSIPLQIAKLIPVLPLYSSKPPIPVLENALWKYADTCVCS